MRSASSELQAVASRAKSSCERNRQHRQRLGGSLRILRTSADQAAPPSIVVAELLPLTGRSAGAGAAAAVGQRPGSRARLEDTGAADARRRPGAPGRRARRSFRLAVRALLDTPVLIGAESPGELEGAISAASLAELHFGVLVAAADDERARLVGRLGIVEATFDPLPVDAAVAREWGRLAAALVARGGKPRRRALDLVIAAWNVADFASLSGLVDARQPTP